MTRRVLIIDDDIRVRAALGDLLASTADLTPAVTAATAAEARAAAEQDGPFDLAVVDVRLPDPATGLALIRRLTTGMPVVAVSVSGAHRAAALAAGATAYLDKDGRPDDLLAALRAALPAERSPR
ncbi:response regulator [Geodermatophilus sp. URMC 62]|uniref:response regulator n=1 Tax=Geodermatophilus sp. URMC 62 TaxID=3423414 RepID=UPI00406C5660